MSTTAPAGNTVISVIGMEEMRAVFMKSPELISPIMQKAIAAGAAILAKHSTRAEIPWFTGNLLHSFREEISPLMARWFPTASYAQKVNDGSSPYWPDYKSESMKSWAEEKGMNAFLVSRSISRKGSPAQPFMDRIKDASVPEIQSLFEKALAQATQALAS
jgi:hypothetical protein